MFVRFADKSAVLVALTTSPSTLTGDSKCVVKLLTAPLVICVSPILISPFLTAVSPMLMLPLLSSVILLLKAKVTFAPLSPLTCSTVKFLPALNSTVFLSAIFFSAALWLSVTAPPSADDFTFQDDFALLKSSFDKSTLKS